MATAPNAVVPGAPITAHDPFFLIKVNIETAPIGLMWRELLRNCFEALVDQKHNETTRLIRIYADDGKAVIINSGQGMTGQELQDVTDLASSLNKKMGISGRLNRGEGAKIATLKFNPEGVRFRSRKDGVVSEVYLYYDAANDRWARMRWEIEEEDGSQGYGEYYEPEVGVDITPLEAARYDAIPGDFTEVKLYGMGPDHCTAYDPYGENYAAGIRNPDDLEKLAIARELFSRFYRYPAVVLPFRVDFDGDSFRAGAKWRPLLSVDEIVTKHPHAFEHLNERFVELGNGVKIEYLKMKLDDKRRSPFTQYSSGFNNACGGIVWQDELYGLLSDSWAREAAYYGIVGLGSQVCVFVHLPEDYPVSDDRFRERISTPSGTTVTMDFWKSEIIAKRPQWLLDLIEANRQKSNDSKNVRDRLRAYVARMFVKVNPNSPSSPNGVKLKVLPGGLGQGGANTPGKPNPDNPKPHTPSDDPQPGHGTGSGQGTGGTAGQKKLKKRHRRVEPDEAGAGKTQAQNVPNFRWVNTREELAEFPDLQNRGAMYIPGTSEYLLNGTFLPLEFLREHVFNEHVMRNHPGLVRNEELEQLVEGKIRDHVAFKVGCAILQAERNRGKDGWVDANIKAATSPEALSTVFSVCQDDAWPVYNSFMKKPEFTHLVEATKNATAAA